ncbi:MAG: glycerol-3-phosphate acyltransferase [Chloroflexi bacterium]|nr:glycerol-3-phosphate acyltransferase [Chloroflexota bacterium]
MTVALVLLTAYLLGSIPTSYLVVYRFTGRDIRTLGNRNPGTMNVWDSVGLRAAMIVAIGDISKGMAAVGIAYLAGVDDRTAVLAALTAVAGHDFSIFLRLHGGNGTAAAVGGMLALVPTAALPSAGAALALFTIVRSRRIAGVIGMLMVPILAYWQGLPEMRLIGVILLLTVTALKIVKFEGFSPARSRPPR